MTNKKELSLEAMEQVTGGVRRRVNTGIQDLNGVIRSGASKSSSKVTSLPNGTIVDTVNDKLVYDPASQRNFVQVYYTDAKGRRCLGWIAASIVGLPR